LVWTTDYGLNATEKRVFDFNDLQDNYRKAQFPVVFLFSGFYWKTMVQMTKDVAKTPRYFECCLKRPKSVLNWGQAT